ncbi:MULTISPECIES: hypothetical protein [Planktothricoides]|uniref:Uncharacterized protein n=2 Tax=Planktothricoides raciborskii TaxID=132608 RepID=A0AAU8JD77_9CYAN|nr:MULTISPECIES: hypothetical protein [Planktothricoides]KOR38490.1 hypothetical protein AM228_00365 [Planktothricoides sp. SR001]MBD2544547.1 hypothetical protein [Planktothricoides raciborskii FACHB-1370]MBD2585553.1 hypothetical protein [Planktothricoides raciborskii FACHB-1261]
MFPIKLIPGAISELLAVVRDTHKITKADRYGLMAAILDESISEEDRFSVDRLLGSIYRGRVQIVDELSTVL